MVPGDRRVGPVVKGRIVERAGGIRLRQHRDRVGTRLRRAGSPFRDSYVELPSPQSGAVGSLVAFRLVVRAEDGSVAAQPGEPEAAAVYSIRAASHLLQHEG